MFSGDEEQVPKEMQKENKRQPKQNQRPTTARGAHKAQTNLLLESWALFGPNAVRKIVAVAHWSALSCGSACTFAIPARVTSARLRPRFRHGRGHNYFASRRTQLWHSNWEPAAALPPCPAVGCNTVPQIKTSPPSWRAKKWRQN